MNKESLVSKGKKLSNGLVYVINVFDLEPSGVIVQAYSQMDSKERMLPISEKELAAAGYSRKKEHLEALIDTIILIKQGNDLILQSENEAISRIRKVPTGDELENMLKDPNGAGNGASINQLLITGLAELCKVKPVGTEAVKYLGEWLLINNPSQPAVRSADDDDDE